MAAASALLNLYIGEVVPISIGILMNAVEAAEIVPISLAPDAFQVDHERFLTVKQLL